MRVQAPIEPSRMTESEMIARVLAGERNVFHDLIRPYEKLVYLTALSILKDESEAEETAQEAVISAYRHLKSFRAEAKFSTWLVTIAVNGARQRLRSAKRAVTDSIDERLENSEGDFTPAFLTDWREIPIEALERQELRSAIRSAVESLPEIYREVFTLRDVDELNVHETSTALGISENVVKVRLHRARMLLQKQLVPLLKSAAPARRGWFGRKL